MTSVIHKSCASCGYSAPQAIFLYFGVHSLLGYFYVLSLLYLSTLESGIKEGCLSN